MENDYIEAMKKINISEEAENRILNNCLNKEERFNMPRKKKIGIMIAAAVMVIGATVFAANGIISSWVCSSSSTPQYKSLPSAEECMKKVGYVPVLMEEFSNGYTFEEGSIVKNNLIDDSGRSNEKFKSLDFDYINADDKIYLSAVKCNSELDNDGDVIASVGDTDIYYSSYIDKCVPVDYKMTEEDKRAEESGEVIFSCGTDNGYTQKVQSVSWEQDDIHYNMMQMDGKLSPDELAALAEEMISK